MTRHTPTPWRTTKAQPNVICNEGGDKWIARALIGDKSPRHIKDAEVAEANAEFIVKAVNSHATLVAALERTKIAIHGYIDRCDFTTGHAILDEVNRALSTEGAPK